MHGDLTRPETPLH